MFNNIYSFSPPITNKSATTSNKATEYIIVDFLSILRNGKEELYNVMLYKNLELEKYIKTIKKQHFTYTTIPSHERIFIIEAPSMATIEDIKAIVLKIKDKFFKLL